MVFKKRAEAHRSGEVPRVVSQPDWRIELGVKFSLDRLVDLAKYPACPIVDIPLDEYMGLRFRRWPRRHDDRDPIKIANLRETLVITVTSREFLHHLGHRLVIPKGSVEKTTYEDRVIDEDPQAYGPPGKRYDGVAEMARAHEKIMPQLRYITGALTVEAAVGWPHAVREAIPQPSPLL